MSVLVLNIKLLKRARTQKSHFTGFGILFWKNIKFITIYTVVFNDSNFTITGKQIVTECHRDMSDPFTRQRMILTVKFTGTFHEVPWPDHQIENICFHVVKEVLWGSFKLHTLVIGPHDAPIRGGTAVSYNCRPLRCWEWNHRQRWMRQATLQLGLWQLSVRQLCREVYLLIMSIQTPRSVRR